MALDWNYLHPKDQIVEVMNRIYQNGMTTTSGGNLSIKDEDGSVWISPSSVDKGTLTRKDIVKINPDGSTEGIHPPSSEYPFHLAVYNVRKDAKAVLHAHPPALVSFSIIRKIPDTKIIPNAKDVCGDVGYALYALPGSEELGEKIAEAFEKGHDTVLMENHGIVTLGDSLLQAYHRLETLDFCARLTLKANTVGSVRLLSDAQIDLLKHKDNELDELEPYTPGSEEKELRTQLCKLIHRSYDRQLVTSTQGTFSAKLSDGSFLITPFGVDRKYIEEKDLVLVKDGKCIAGKKPSRSVKIHMKMYDKYPQCQAICIAHPPNVLAFGVCNDVRFDTRTIPESYIVLKDIPVLPYGTQFMNIDGLLETMTPKNPVVICENDCIIVMGKNILEAFDRLEVAEYSAQAVINAKATGPVVPIGEEDVQELIKVFLSEEI